MGRNEILFKAIKSGSLRVSRPDLIPVRKLERYLRYSACLNKLCEAITYSLVNKDRYTEAWNIFNACSNYPNKDSLAVYSIKPIKDFSDIIAVDYSILCSSESNVILDKYPVLRDILYTEIRLVINDR